MLIMEYKVSTLIKLLSCFMYLVTVCSSQSLRIEVSSSNKIEPGASVSVRCTVDRSVLSTDITWIRTQGSQVSKLGVSGPSFRSLEQDYESLGRYSLAQETSGTLITYVLQITGVQYEDSATISCQLGSYKGNGQVFSQALAVCEDTNSASCKCMISQGWATPTCFQEPPDSRADAYRNAMIGVIVCLVIAIVYGIVVSVMLSRDCAARMKVKAKRKLEALELSRNQQHTSQQALNSPDSQNTYPGYHDDPNYPSGGQYEGLRGHTISGDPNAYQQINVDVHTSGYGSGESSISNGIQGNDRYDNQQNSGVVNGGFNDNDTELPKYEKAYSNSATTQGTPVQQRGQQAYPGNTLPDGSKGARPKQQSQGPHTFTPISANQNTGSQYLQTKPNPPTHKNPYQQSPGYGQKGPAQYATYQDNLQTVSQSSAPQITHAEHVPQGARSEHRRQPVRAEDQRNAYTDVRKEEQPRDRQHYSQPRKLDFVNSKVQREEQPYLSQVDTAI